MESNSVDYVHECSSGNVTLDNEDVVVMGKWSDYTGSDATIGAAEVMYQGAENKVFGQRADIEGEDVSEHTRRGERASTHRQRQKLVYKDFRGGVEK